MGIQGSWCGELSGFIVWRSRFHGVGSFRIQSSWCRDQTCRCACRPPPCPVGPLGFNFSQHSPTTRRLAERTAGEAFLLFAFFIVRVILFCCVWGSPMPSVKAFRSFRPSVERICGKALFSDLQDPVLQCIRLAVMSYRVSLARPGPKRHFSRFFSTFRSFRFF